MSYGEENAIARLKFSLTVIRLAHSNVVITNDNYKDVNLLFLVWSPNTSLVKQTFLLEEHQYPTTLENLHTNLLLCHDYIG